MTKTFAAFALLSTIAFSASAQDTVGSVEMDGKKIEVSGMGHKRTIACDGRDLIVEGSRHVIIATGVCGNVDVSGGSNAVTAAMAPNRKLVVAGSEHTVSTKGPVTHADISGGSNIVAVEIAPKGKLEVAGSSHSIKWRSNGQTVQDISGASHKISRQN